MRSSIIQIVDRDKRLPAFGAIIVVLSADHDATVFTPKCANLAQEKGGIHMPPIPTACQPIADEIANLQARDTQLRAQLPTLTGEQAWAVLTDIATGRQTLEEKQAELTACIQANTAALQGQLVVINVGPPASAVSRMVGILDAAADIPAQVATLAVQADSFSFAGQLPQSVALTVSTAGDPDILGPDFCSNVMAAASVSPAPVRIEIVLGPLVRIKAADFLEEITAESTGAFLAGHRFVKFTMQHRKLAIQEQATVCSVSGRLVIEGPDRPIGQPNEPSWEGPFAAGVRYCLIPNGNPKAAPLIDPVFVDEWINVPGSPGAALFGLEPQIQSKLREYFEYQIWTRLNTLVPVAICAALALPHLPPEVSIAIRRVSIKDSAIEFQPTLGCIGTALSTFVPPVVPPLPGSS